MLGTSDAWSTSHLSQQTSVLYCRLSDFSSFTYSNKLWLNLAHGKCQYFVICGLPSQLSWLPFGEYYHDIVSKNGSMYYDHLQCTSITAKDTEYIVVRSQKYSRLRCLLRVTGLVICFYLGWSGSILQFRQNIIQSHGYLLAAVV